MKKIRKISLTLLMLFFSTNLFAAQSQIAQVNGMMCIKCQKMVTKALQAASPDAKVTVSWPEGVAISAFGDKSNLTDEDIATPSGQDTVTFASGLAACKAFVTIFWHLMHIIPFT
jgi:copper chaperone CopZ